MNTKYSFLTFSLFFLFLGSCFSQPHFSQGDTLILSWIPPSDSDLSHFIAYFTSQDLERKAQITIRDWNEISDSLQHIFFLPLECGNWIVEMTALDLSLNESDHSDPFHFHIDKAKPGKPVAVKIFLYQKP